MNCYNKNRPFYSTQVYNNPVNQETAKYLLDLNRQFYQSFAQPFSATRQRLQPGVSRVLVGLDPEARILDLGCGNGELARALARRGHQGSYVGIDFSQELLAKAQESIPEGFEARFIQAELASTDWNARLPKEGFDRILAFAVLHHIPGEALRRQILLKIRTLLAADGRLIHSEWQFLNSARLRQRMQPWEKAGLSPAEVDPGDHLLDWRRGGYGLRYVHHFSEDELARLAGETDYRIQETFYSDGESGDLGLYQIWIKAPLSRPHTRNGRP